MLKNQTVFAGRYRILSLIGSGGMADVYKAEDLQERRQVALKILKRDLADEAYLLRSFKTEGQAAASLNNANVVAVYDVGNAGDDYYIAMEYIDGITLKEYIRRKGKLSPRETMAITAQVAVGLRAAHAKHIIHRDVKPQNIILSRDGKVKVADFGIARANTDETKSMSTQAMGSVHYISPEQARGGVCDERSDIYSLGISMYEMITGKVPFDKATSIAVALAHMNETMIAPSQLNPECPTALEQIIFRCTQKSRERRYHNCTELLQDLKIAVSTPGFDFERNEKDSLLKSDTMVITGKDLETLKKAGKKPLREAADDPDEGEAEETGRTSEGRKAAGRGGKNGLFAEDKKEDEKPLFDKVVLIIGIILAVLIAFMAVYIILSFSGCRQKSSGKASSESGSTTIDEENPELETFDENHYDPETQALVPNVVGVMVNSAMKQLEDAGLNYQISTNVVYSDIYKIGTVVKQSYPEGTVVLKGATILITISSGSDKFEIDDSYIGMSLNDFKNTVSTLQDVIDFEYKGVNSETVEANKIISIDPSSGTVGSGDHVTVTYSTGPNKVSMPDLLNKTQAEAVKKLNNLGLELGEITEDYSLEYAEGCIMEQQYEAGATVTSGTKINVTVSKGPKPQKVPNVVGMKQEEAEKALEELNFVVEVKEEVTADSDKLGTVLKQDAEPDSTLKEGEKITITVAGRGSQQTVPDVTGMTPDEAVKYLKDNGGFTNVTISDKKETTSDADKVGTVASQTPAAKSKLYADEAIVLTVYAAEETTTAAAATTAAETSATAQATESAAASSSETAAAADSSSAQ